MIVVFLALAVAAALGAISASEALRDNFFIKNGGDFGSASLSATDAELVSLVAAGEGQFRRRGR